MSQVKAAINFMQDPPKFLMDHCLTKMVVCLRILLSIMTLRLCHRRCGEHLTTWYGHDHKICRRLVRDTFNQVKLDLYPDVYQQSRFNTTVNPTLYNFVT